jgi:lysine 2,3-aminomutase
MRTERLVQLFARLREVPSVETIRLATRAPVTLPSRITTELTRALRPFHPVWVMTHFNHPKEITRQSTRACERLVDAGFPVMNQTVLLRGINDDVETLETLFRALIRRRVKPYYLLQADPVRGTSHLRTPLQTGLSLIGALQGRLSGLALPKFVVDTPGGMGKVALVPDAIVSRSDGHTVLRTFRGEAVYVDP